MFKRTIAALLSIFMLIMSSAVISAAGDVYDLTYDISSGGKNEIIIKQGDIITVDFYMKRTDKDASFDLLSYQNEIEYDKDFFELIVPEEWNFRYTPDSEDKVHDERVSGQQKIIKITEIDVYGLNQEEWIGSFQLKAIGQKGTSSTVRSSYAKAKNLDGDQSNITAVDLKVTIAQEYSVTYSDEIFDKAVTGKIAYKGIDYQGKISDSVYEEIYDWTVSYEIGGITQQVACDGNSFTIPGVNIVGNMKLDYSKKLNITIHIEPYAPGLTLIRIEGAVPGYTFGGNKMIISPNSDNMGAWIVEGEMSEEEAQGMVGVSEEASDAVVDSTDISQDGKTSLNDLAIVLGCSEGYYESTTATEVTRYLLSDVNGDRKVTQSDYTDIVTSYKQVKE